MLDAIDNSPEILRIEGFLSFNSAEIQLGNVTAIIGPQASGKSIVAKLIHFGRTYLDRLFTAAGRGSFSLREFKTSQVEDFQKVFGRLEGFSGGFEITYQIDNLEVSINRGDKSSQVRIYHSKNIDSLLGRIKRARANFEKNLMSSESSRIKPSTFAFRREYEGEFYDSVPDSLFVPASRSFYSTVSDELFSFLASDERVDPLTAQFGSYYEFARRRISGEFGIESKAKQEQARSDMRPVIAGEFVRSRGRDFIDTSWGRVPLRSASSGQQEALPLFLSLLDYPKASSPNQMLIIEEPEAHLFPTAQKYILDLMVATASKNLCDMLFTTHSPYVVACLNNHIAKQHGENKFPSFAAYLANEGTVVSILDEDGYIDANFLDSVSEEIAKEFLRLVD